MMMMMMKRIKINIELYRLDQRATNYLYRADLMKQRIKNKKKRKEKKRKKKKEKIMKFQFELSLIYYLF